MATGRTVDEKKADWAQAFALVEPTLNPPLYRNALSTTMGLPSPDGTPLPAALALARIVSANTRTAAIVAALITQTGIKPISLDLDE